MRIDIANKQSKLKIRLHRLRSLLLRVARAERLKGNISVALVSDSQMRTLNRRFMNKNSSTDVLSFDLRTGKPLRSGKALAEDIACEIVVNAERAVSVAESYGLSPVDELTLYCIHGLLHFAGYDDDTERNRTRMAAKQKLLLSRVLADRRGRRR